MKGTIKYSLILGIICFLASGILAVVNAVTEPQIRLQQEEQEKAALEEVLPEAARFQVKTMKDLDYYLAFDNNNKLIGFAIKAEAKGYSSDILTLASINLDLKIKNIKVLSQNETPGLGNRIQDPSFSEQFRGKDLNSMDSIDTITGATISSSAVIESIKNRLSDLEDILLREIKNAG